MMHRCWTADTTHSRHAGWPISPPEIISAVISSGAARTSPLSFIALHHFHGAAARVAPDATAFGLRRSHFLMEIVAAWKPNESKNAPVHRRWVTELSSTIAPLALPGGYPNFLTPDDREQLGMAYGGNASRLRALKRRYDPDNVF